MKTKIAYFSLIGLLIFILEFRFAITTVSANDLWVGELRVDQSAVANAEDYQTYLMATTLPTDPYGNTSNWLAIIGSTDNTATQVGLFAGSDGLHWFVETFYQPLGVTCLRGTG